MRCQFHNVWIVRAWWPAPRPGESVMRLRYWTDYHAEQMAEALQRHGMTTEVVQGVAP